MKHAVMFVLVEGNDDERFFAKIIVPLLSTGYHSVKLVQHAQKRPKEIRRLLAAMHQIDGDYLFVKDLDSAPCVRKRKQTVARKIYNVNGEKVIVVVRDIEGWYLAGLDDAASKKLGIQALHSTEDVTKRRFIELTPRKFQGDRTHFLSEILNHFSLRTGEQKNESLRYLIHKHIP